MSGTAERLGSWPLQKLTDGASEDPFLLGLGQLVGIPDEMEGLRVGVLSRIPPLGFRVAILEADAPVEPRGVSGPHQAPRAERLEHQMKARPQVGVGIARLG